MAEAVTSLLPQPPLPQPAPLAATCGCGASAIWLLLARLKGTQFLWRGAARLVVGISWHSYVPYTLVQSGTQHLICAEYGPQMHVCIGGVLWCACRGCTLRALSLLNCSCLNWSHKR